MRNALRYKASDKLARGVSAWSFKEAVFIRIWSVVWFIFCRFTIKKMNFFRLWMLRLFGAKIHGRPFVFPSAKIYAPFNLELFDRACIGPEVNVYNLGKVVLRENSTISQGTMLCGGTHDLSSPKLPLMVGDIEIGRDVFVGVRALILPGLRIGDGSVVGAGALVTKNVLEWSIVAGNPAREKGKRSLIDG